MAKFRQRPVEVEAVRFTGTNGDAIEAFADSHRVYVSNGTVKIRTPEGTLRASAGDWIVRSVGGDCVPCRPDVFAATYEPVDD